MSVKQWLESLSMTQYLRLFVSNGFDTLAKCSTLTDFDLDRIGVTRVGHRKRILSHIKTAQDFSVAPSEFREEMQPLPEDHLFSSPVEVGNLLDLGPPDYLAVTGQEPPCFPFDLPPSHDVLGVLDDIPDSDKKKPIPVPRKSIDTKPATDIPVPKPRLKKPSLQNIGVTETSIGDSFKANVTSEGSNEPNSVGKTTADVRNLDVDAKTVRSSRYGDGIVYADVIFEPCLTSDLNSSSRAVESTSTSMSDCAVGSRPESIYSLVEAVSPLSSASSARLPMSVSYEGDVEDVETPGGEVYFDPPCSRSNVPDGVSSKNDANAYAGVWNMTSGVAVSQQRRDIRLNENSLDDVRWDSSSSSSRDESRAVLPSITATVPVSSQTSRPDVAARTQPPMFQAQAQKPPPVPARKLDLKSSNSDPTESSTSASRDFGTSAGLVFWDTEIRTFADATSDPSLKLLAAAAPKSRTEVTPVGAINRPPYPTPPGRPAPAQPSRGNAPVPLQPSRNAPLPQCGGEKGKVPHPPFPLLPGRPAPVPPVLSSDTSSTSPVSTASTTPPLNVKLLIPPVGNGPPPLPPKVGVPAVGSLSETDYSLAGHVADDVFNEEAEILADASFAESDDTLSDGGEFYDNVFQRSTSDAGCQPAPIASSVSTRQTSRKGYLYKLMSISKKLAKPWQKIWAVFDGAELRYFSSNKSFVSKRIIPLCTMHKVEVETKNGDLHPYFFKLSTRDRVYTFAADDVDDMSWWANIIMTAIIQTENERKSFIEGGEMNSPDIEGFVRMEGSKCKRYLVVKKAKFCFYNTIEDFKSFTPIHRVEMQLASVKDVGRFKLQLFTPHVAFMLIFESQDELNEWKNVFEDSISLGLGDDSIITEVYANLSNRYCADCEMADPEWSAINLGITLCKFCAGVHRSLSWSKVRSLRMDSKVWKPSVRQLLITIGNDHSNNFWEWLLLKENRIDSKTDFNKRRDFILRKYCNKQFCRLHPSHSNQNELNEALCKMVQLGNVLETLELVFSGADVLCSSRNNETPIQLARKAQQVLQEEFLYLNGGDLDVAQSPVQGPGPWTSGICHRGYLFKTGSNVRGEFLRRWCVLDSGVFSYFDTDKSPVANDSIEKKDMLSVALAFDDRYEFTFEVGTTKQGGRVFLFAAESNDERMQWITKLAKVMANISPMDVDKITSLNRGGNVYIRWATSREWLTTWAEISHKTLKIFNKKDHLFEEVDLRKAKSITYLHPNERCVESFDDGPPFIVHLRNAKNVYVQGDLKIETERWFSTIQKAMTESDHCLANQSLTSDNIPVIVEKCIGFVVLYGLEVEGIYRLNGQHSKVTRLLELFMSDACGLAIKQEEFQVHDVSNTFKRFFRSLDDPLLTHKLYSKWIEATVYPDIVTKLQLYKALLKALPQINYHTLKQVITHLARVAEMDQINKMTITNLASIFGPVLMRLDEEKDSGFGATNLEINVVKDLTENHVLLFEVKEEELEQEKKIEEARKKIEMLNNQAIGSQVEQMQDVIIGVHINSKDGHIIPLKVPMQMRVQELQDYVIEKAGLNAGLHWSLFEVICNGELERPLHYTEPVVGVTMKWIDWPMEFCRDNFLCLKQNYIYEKILLQEDPHPSMFCELKYASKKAFHKYCFDFSRYCLTYRTNTRAPTPTASWNVEDLVIYVGCQKQRNPPTRWCFSFVCSGEQLVSPYFGHCVSCSNDEELYRWLSVLLRAQHPEGLVSSGSPRGASSQSGPVELRPRGISNQADQLSSESQRTRWMKPMSSIFQKLTQR